MSDRKSNLWLSGSWQTLQAQLAEEIKAEKTSDLFKPALVLCGNRLLAQHLQGEIYAELNRDGLGINVRFILLPDLVNRLYYTEPLPEYQTRDSKFLKYVLLKDLLLALPDKHYFGGIKTNPGLTQVILAEHQDLKDALIVGESFRTVKQDLAGAQSPEKMAWLFEIFEAFDRRLDKYEADWQRYLIAAGKARNFAAAFRADRLFVYGFYDFTEAQKELLAALAEKAALEIFMFRPEQDFYFDYARPVFKFYAEGLQAENQELGPPVGRSDLALFRAALASAGDGRERDAVNFKADGTLSIALAPGTEREALEVCREIMRLVRKHGLRFDEIGVLVRDFEKYSRPLQEAFELHGIPGHVVSGRPLSDFSPVRALLRLLFCATENYSRASIIRFLTSSAASAGLFGGAREPFAGLMDLVSREALVVAGLDEWKERMGKYLLAQDKNIERVRSYSERSGEEDEEAEKKIELIERKKQAAKKLREIVDKLGRDLEPLAQGASFAAMAGAVRKLAQECIDFGPANPDSDDASSGAEIKAKLEGVLEEIAALDSAGVRADFPTFLELFSRGLASEAIRGRPFRQGGVCLSELMAARGVQFRAVILPGLNEASFPLKIGESPLLADDDREVINRGLKQPNRLGPKWRQMQEERLLFALACGQAREFLALTCSWLDLENNRELPPSYLLVDALNRALGGQVEFDRLRELARTCSWIRSVELSDFAPGREELALGPADFELLRLSDSPDSAAAHLLKDESIRRLARLAAERWEGEGVGEFTGFLAGNGFSPGPFSIISQNISVSRLQKFLTCPFLFFLARVLEAEKIEEPERIWDFEKIAQGNVVHEAMDGIFRELKNKKEFSPEKYSQLLAKILEEKGVEYLTEAFPAARSLIEMELNDLKFYLLHWRSEVAPEPRFDSWSTEMNIPALPVDYEPGKKTVGLKGRIDRLDRGAQSAEVIDYKVGRADSLRKSPVRQLQLPIYLLSVINMLGASARGKLAVPSENITARFLVMDPQGLAGVDKSMEFRGAQKERYLAELRKAVAIAAESIEQGAFVAVPSEKKENCKNCDYSNMCGGAAASYRKKAGGPVVKDLADRISSLNFKDEPDGKKPAK